MMSEIVGKYINIVAPFISAVYYRTLGINSVHVPIDDLKQFIEAQDNPYGGNIKMIWEGKRYKVFKWQNINLSRRNINQPVTFDAWIFGGGTNSVGVREHFYDLHLVRSAIKQTFDTETEYTELGKLFKR